MNYVVLITMALWFSLNGNLKSIEKEEHIHDKFEVMIDAEYIIENRGVLIENCATDMDLNDTNQREIPCNLRIWTVTIYSDGDWECSTGGDFPCFPCAEPVENPN